MTAAAPSTALATIQPIVTDAGRLALAGFLAGYRGLTREACALDLRQFTSWCRARALSLFAVRRAGIEGFARELEVRRRARATVTRRLRTIAGFCKYAVEEELLEHSPAAHVRRPRLDYDSQAVALDRNELGALPVAAGPGPPAGHALISLLALSGLRVSEATGAGLGHLGLERGHRTLTITRKGGKVVTVPLAPRTARAIDLAIAVHHRRAGCRGPAARRARSSLSRRPADHDPVRPGPRQPGPACHLHSRRLRRGRRPVIPYPPGQLRPAVAAAGRSCPHDAAVTHGDPGTNANRRSA